MNVKMLDGWINCKFKFIFQNLPLNAHLIKQLSGVLLKKMTIIILLKWIVQNKLPNSILYRKPLQSNYKYACSITFELVEI